MVIGLENTDDPRAQSLAFDLARRWINNNYVAYQQSIPNAMFEKVYWTKLVLLFINLIFFFFLV